MSFLFYFYHLLLINLICRFITNIFRFINYFYFTKFYQQDDRNNYKNESENTIIIWKGFMKNCIRIISRFIPLIFPNFFVINSSSQKVSVEFLFLPFR